jgi:predicted GIY-YIG superfamily endonuclease
VLNCGFFQDFIVVVVHYFYILRCADASLYLGQTESLDERVRIHNHGT